VTTIPAELSFIHVSGPEPHVRRTRKILKGHPEIRELFGRNPWTAAITLGIVGGQFVVAYLLRESAWWVVLVASWFLGAFAIHALFAIIHECAHNLVFTRSSWNKALSIVANLPSIFPSAMGFRNYHLIHHRYQGESGWDADLAGETEASWVGRSTPRKLIWMFFFIIVEGILRPARVKKVMLYEPWALANAAAGLFVAVLVAWLWGWASLVYLVLSLVFAVGLHPLGARWIQEHYVFKADQETYSYYGPLNRVSLNVGHHNEHHDFMVVPWNRLPKVRALAPEYYNTLHFHRSWTKLWLRFLFDPKVTLFDRVVRPDHDDVRRQRLTSRETQQIQDDAVAPDKPHATDE